MKYPLCAGARDDGRTEFTMITVGGKRIAAFTGPDPNKNGRSAGNRMGRGGVVT